MELLYAGFVVLVLGLLVLDLGVFHRTPHVVGVKESLGWSAAWIGLGVGFAAVIYLGYDQRWLGLGTGIDTMTDAPVTAGGAVIYNDGGSAALKYLTGYVVEKSLAVDNIFVVAMIFGSLGVPRLYQHRVLFWGIVGALVMRGAMIALGAVLIARFGWIMYVFGGFLILTGLKMLVGSGAAHDPTGGRVVRAVRRLVSVTERFHAERFVVRAGSAASHAPATPGAPSEPDRVVALARPGAWLITPLLLALILVELTDVIFAVDSIPAIFAITTDPFLVFTSNVFAMLGMRSLYFALAGMIERFRYLKVSLSVVLVAIGAKMLAHGPLRAWLGDHVHLAMLAVIAAILGAGVLASLVIRRPVTVLEPAR